MSTADPPLCEEGRRRVHSCAEDSSGVMFSTTVVSCATVNGGVRGQASRHFRSRCTPWYRTRCRFPCDRQDDGAEVRRRRSRQDLWVVEVWVGSVVSLTSRPEGGGVDRPSHDWWLGCGPQPQTRIIEYPVSVGTEMDLLTFGTSRP